jgi:hypothetical protein
MREKRNRSTNSLPWHWMEVVSFMPWLLYPQGESPQYPLERRLGGFQSSQSLHSGKEKEISVLAGN